MAIQAKRFERRIVILAKIETDYGTSAAPTAAANAIRVMTGATITPMAGDTVQRDLVSPHMGAQGILLAGDYAEVKFKVELTGAGDAGDVPAYGPLLRACSMAETIVADTSVTYTPVTDGPEAVTIFWNDDGVNHAMLGARGTAVLTLVPKQIPTVEFTLRGLAGPIADMARPAATYAPMPDPLIVRTTVTTTNLHGQALAAPTETVTVDLGNQLELRNLIGEDEVIIADRSMKGTAVLEAKTLAATNWFQVVKDRTRGALAVQHGTVAGNIVELAAPAVEIDRPSYGATQGIRNISLPLIMCPVSGNDELSIIVR